MANLHHYAGRQTTPARPAAGPRAVDAVEALEARVLLSAGPRVVFATVRDGGEYVSPGGFSFAFDRAVAPFTAAACVVRSVDNPAATFPYKDVDGITSDLDGTRHFVNFKDALPAGRYTLTLRSGNAAAGGVEAAADGADLDGELPASRQLPSGDGTAGGDFVVGFSVLPYTGVPPSPKELTAQPLSDREIELGWYDDTTVDWNFLVERADGDGPFAQIDSYRNGTDANSAHYIDTTAAAGHTYRYRLRADAYTDDGHVFSPYSNEAVGAVLPADRTLPVASLASRAGAVPDWLTASGGAVYFTWGGSQPASAWQPANGTELWKSDGTAAGTARLFQGQVGGLIDVAGTLYFAGADASHGLELWKTDGTPAGTVLAVDVKPGAASSSPRPLGVLGGKLLFAVPRAGHAYELWKTDGTPAGTSQVTDKLAYLDDVPENAPEARRLFTVSGGRFFFRRAAGDGSDAGELWATNGSAAGTAAVAGAVNPTWLTDVAGTLYLGAGTDSGGDAGLYKVAAGASSTVRVKVFAGATGAGAVANVTAVGSLAFFAAGLPDSSVGPQLWRSDGTAAGTYYVRFGAEAGVGVRYPNQIAAVNGQAYYLSNDVNWNEFFGHFRRADGSPAGTRDVRDFEGRAGDGPYFSAVAGSTYLYSDGLDLWTSDGTREGTFKIDRVGNYTGIRNGTRPPSTAYLFGGSPAVTANGNVFFSGPADAGDGRTLRVAALTPPAAPTGVVTGDGGSTLALTAAASNALTATTPKKAAKSKPSKPAKRKPVRTAKASTPANLSAASGPVLSASSGGVTVTWRDNARNETGFVVDRLRSAADAVPQATYFAPANATSLTDPTAPAGGGVYRVRSYNAAGYSPAALSVVAPAVASVAVNDGAAQRSMVNRLTITFNQSGVTLDAGAVVLTRRDGGPAPALTLTPSPAAGPSAFVVTFSGTGVVGGSLADGVYDLTVVASKAHANGAAMTADYASKFHRLYSDADGDGDSDNADLLQLRPTLLKTSADPAYSSWFDYDASGTVDNLDVFQVRSRRGLVFQGY